MNSSAIDLIRSCKFLYLHSISEVEGDGLRVVLHEAEIGGPVDAKIVAKEAMPELRRLLADSNQIVHGPQCRVFELRWERYVGYSVENESYALPEPPGSVGEGRLIVEHSASVYLDYLKRATFAAADFPGPFSHWAIHCLDHIVNVASEIKPTIEVCGGA